MIQDILLLSDPVLIPDLKGVLLDANPRLNVTPIFSNEQLARRCQDTLERTRLLSFGSDIIVPATILDRLTCGAYNFHPGPPTHPGRFPSSFFIYQGGTRFGSTVHEMIAKVDAGQICAVDWFTTPPDIDCLTLNSLSFQSLLSLFKKLAPHLSQKLSPLPTIDETWRGKNTTQKDFDALCKLPPNVSLDEFQRRYRAVGEGPNHALEITIHGHRFCLDNQHINPDITIGGKKR